MSGPRPITLLIAALGGEGGGVLTDWIVTAAAEAGFPVQSTSIPGVAQRTGATTYYIEILPVQTRELGGKRPVLALTPGVGDIDIAVASELLEAGRTVATGFVTPERTFVIASLVALLCHGREDRHGRRPLRPGQAHQGRSSSTRARRCCSTWKRWPSNRGSIISAVMLGAIAGCGRLPLTAEQFEAAIRADGKAVENNLRGFRAGLEAARAKLAPVAPRDPKKHRAQDARTARARGHLFVAAAGAGNRGRRRAAADRLSRRALRAALSRPAARDERRRPSRRRAGQAAERSRAPSRRAHVVRGRGAGGAGQDRAGAHAPHRAGRVARARTSPIRCTISSSPASRN